jgi:hypothetical protein
MKYCVNPGLTRLSAAPVLAFLLALPGCGGGGPAAQADEVQAAPAVMAHKQAQELDQSLNGDVLWVNADCCGSLGANVAVGVTVGITYAMQAAGNLPDSVPVFVTGADQQLVGKVVNRLAEGGMRRVFQVVPPRDNTGGAAG